jgi:hypothetical protein
MTVPTAYKTPSPDKVYLTRSAYRLIEEEARRGSQAGLENETGGILIGRRLDQANRIELLILAATGPGEQAYHHPVEFNPDVEYVNRKLQEYHSSHPRTDYIGTWHKHPSRYQTFSSGDVATAHALFRDPDYRMEEIINPIVWVEHGQFTIRYYYMSRQMARRGEPFVEINASRVTIIDDNHALVQQELAPTRSRPTGPLAVEGANNERISQEYRQLTQRGYQTKIRQQGEEYFFEVRHERHPDVLIYLVAPAGFPQIPPTLIVERNGQALPPNDGGIINQWTFSRGASSLADVADGVLATLEPPPAVQPAPPPVPAVAPVRRKPRQNSSNPLIALLSVLLIALLGTAGWLFISSGQTAERLAAEQTAQAASANSTQTSTVLNATSEAATSVAAATASIVAEWTALERLPLDEQLTKLEAWLIDGRTTDPKNISIKQRIFDTRLRYIDLLITSSPPRFVEARIEAEKAMEESSEDSAQKKAAEDRFVAVLIAQARDALSQNQIIDAQNILAAWKGEELYPERKSEFDKLTNDIQTAYDALDNRKKIEYAWASYDKGSQSGDWDTAVLALDTILSITGQQPDAAIYGTAEYDLRTLNVLDLQAKARLNYAPTLWLGGDLLAAGAQIAAVEALTPTLLLPDTLLQASNARATLTEASEWWGKVTTAQAGRNWEAMATALDRLAILAGFGPNARYPQSRTQTVSDLQETVQQQLAAAQPKPTSPPRPAATATPRPTDTPAPVNTNPITDTGQVSDTNPLPPQQLPTYNIAIAEISEQDFAARSDTPTAGVNTYLEGPDGVVIRAGGVEIALSNRFTLLQGQGVVELVSDGSGEQVITTSKPAYTIEPGKYYQITVTKVP